MIGKNLKKRLISFGLATAVLSGTFSTVSFGATPDAMPDVATAVEFKESDRVVHYARSTGTARNVAWKGIGALYHVPSQLTSVSP